MVQFKHILPNSCPVHATMLNVLGATEVNCQCLQLLAVRKQSYLPDSHLIKWVNSLLFHIFFVNTLKVSTRKITKVLIWHIKKFILCYIFYEIKFQNRFQVILSTQVIKGFSAVIVIVNWLVSF